MNPIELIAFAAFVVVVAVIFAAPLSIGAARRQREFAQLAGRVAQIDRKLDAIMQHLELAPAPEAAPGPLVSAGPDWSDIDHLLAQGRKIEAIKRYRELTGTGLAEAKDAVESRQLR